MLAVISVVTTVAASGPTFNIFPIAYDGSMNTDYPLLDVRNVTKSEGWSTSQADHDAGVNADPGDEVEFLVYYHNGVPDDPSNTATNVLLKAILPATSATTFTVGAQLSATNAQTVTSAQKGNDVTVRINGTTAQTLTLIPGTTIWLPDRGTTQQTMPDTITTSGVSLGDIRGCWNFAGFVKFKVRVSTVQPQGALSIVKQVRNVTQGQASFVNQTNANPDDVVEFKLTGTNTGQATIQSVYFTDTLPTQLSYVQGSLQTSQQSLSGDLFSGGLNMGTMAPGSTASVTFRAKVASAAQFPNGTTNIDNIGKIRGQNPVVAESTATARVVVTITSVEKCSVETRATLNGSTYTGALNYTIFGPANINGTTVPQVFTGQPVGTYSASYQSSGPAGAQFAGVTPQSGSCPVNGTLLFIFAFTRQDAPNITIDKTVRNVTTGATAFADSADAQPSQTVEFKIVLTNTGNVDLFNVITRDVLPAGMTFVDGSLTVNGGNSGCDSCYFSPSAGGGVNIGTIAQNANKTIVFRTLLAGQSNFPVGQTVMTNTAYLSAGSITRQDTATVVVNKSAPQKENGTPSGRP